MTIKPLTHEMGQTKVLPLYFMTLTCKMQVIHTILFESAPMTTCTDPIFPHTLYIFTKKKSFQTQDYEGAGVANFLQWRVA